MRPIYKSLILAAMKLQVSVSLQAQVTDGESTTQTPIPAEVLNSLLVDLVAPNVSGARDLLKSGECTIDGSDLSIMLNSGDWIKGGVYRLQVSATFGTQTEVIYALDVNVPRYDALASEPQVYEDSVTVVSTYGDGDNSGADATVYAKDGDGYAHITTPLSIGNADGDGASIQATSDGAIASGYAGDGASIRATGNGAIASGNADGDGASIQATNAGAIASGSADGDGASIQATVDGAIASGCASDGASIQATSAGAIASGNADGDGASIQATGDGAIASGNADGDGASIQATGNGAIASGNANGDGASIQATGNGAIASGNAGDGASIQATGDGAIVSGYAGDGASIRATSDGAIASGNADTTNGNVEASGHASQAFGIGVKAVQDAQMVVGKCNVVDDDDTFQFIVGNGTGDINRHNAFAVTKSGELALFEADGTPVILNAATLKALIESVANA